MKYLNCLINIMNICLSTHCAHFSRKSEDRPPRARCMLQTALQAKGAVAIPVGWKWRKEGERTGRRLHLPTIIQKSEDLEGVESQGKDLLFPLQLQRVLKFVCVSISISQTLSNKRMNENAQINEPPMKWI